MSAVTGHTSSPRPMSGSRDHTLRVRDRGRALRLLTRLTVHAFVGSLWGEMAVWEPSGRRCPTPGVEPSPSEMAQPSAK